MSTWISKGAVVAALIFALTACVLAELPGAGGQATRSLPVAGGALNVTGPSGYCIDGKASRDSDNGAFVLFGTCAALSRSRAAGQPANAALLTASIAKDSSDTPLDARFAAITGFFQSKPGRAALSRSGKGNTVTINRAFSDGGVLYLSITDSSRRLDGLEPRYWRSIFELRGMMVTLSVMSHASQPVADKELKRTLDTFVRRMRMANSGNGR